MFEFVGKGVIEIGGCALLEITKQFVVKFGIGSKAYRIDKARKGILEVVVIKKINRVKTSYGDYIINYVDTFNAVWFESDLAYQSEAVALAIAYWNKVLNETQHALLRDCS